nr:DMT family transporter [Actinomyces timonensis]
MLPPIRTLTVGAGIPPAQPGHRARRAEGSGRGLSPPARISTDPGARCWGNPTPPGPGSPNHTGRSALERPARDPGALGRRGSGEGGKSAAACALCWRRLLRLTRRQALTGIGVGTVYGLAQIAQTVGLRYTPASTAGFVTALYVVITPMLALVLLRTRVSRVTWVAAVLALGGVSVLSLDGFALGAGIPLLMASAFLYALHIVLLGSLVQGQDPLSLTALQMLGICAVLWPAALPGGVRVPMVWGVWGPLLWMALASGLLALLLQTWAQARMSATRAVVVMTFEPVFASLFAILAGQEPMTWRLLVGGGLALTAMLLSELGPVVRAERLARRGGQEQAASAPGAG